MTSRGPVRTCIGCRRAAPVTDLVRVARHEDGTLRVDRVAPGRGAWLCRSPEAGVPVAGCLDQAVRRQAFSRAFKVKVDAAAATSLRDSTEERARMEKGGRRHGDRPQKGLT